MLSIINPGNKTLRISCPTKRKEGIKEYENIKSKIKSSYEPSQYSIYSC